MDRADMERWPLSNERLHFVDSIHSGKFSLFLEALDRAYVVAMDAEWKPLRSNNRKTFPRVSIMQLACRLANRSEEPLRCDHDSTDSAQNSDLEVKISTNASIELVNAANIIKDDKSTNSKAQGSSLSTSHINRGAGPLHQAGHCNSEEGQKCLELSQSRLEENQEIIFILDLMSLPVNSFWEAMKRMLVSSTVLKLGFKFKQDLMNLAKSFPGPDSHSCFDKVDPYVDIGKLFLELCGWDGTHVNNLSLATICEQVVGYTLCKDLQCSDWEQRPLTMEQQVYAAADVHCLLVAYDVLKNKALKGHSHSASSTITEDGIGAILHNSLGSWLASPGGNVLHARRGVATVMVKSAVTSRILVTTDLPADPFSAAHTLLIGKFGERLLLSEEMSKRSTKKKPKRAQGNRDTHVGGQVFVGPPPWDPSCGGDGVPKFICDSMVGGLAKHLRNVGFDTVDFRMKKSDPRKMVELAEKEGRVLLTQDVKLLRRGFIPPNCAYQVKSDGKQEQLTEVVKRFHLEILEENLLSRCNKCNGEFFPNALTPEEALAAFPEGQTFPQQAMQERFLFWQCSQCMHMYWQGTQFQRALQNFQAFARKVQTTQ